MSIQWTNLYRTFLFSLLVSCLLNCFSLYSDAQTLDRGSGLASMNESCPFDSQCKDLPADCITCSFSTDCVYGTTVNVTCSPLDNVTCEGEDVFNRSSYCMFCYQLPQSLSCCSPNITCQAPGTPNSLYISTCKPYDDSILCIPPRSYQKRLPCRYSTGTRWSTAILLSITLGGFGIDRFYLGYWPSALGKLFSFGGLGVWSILDVLLILTGYLTPANGSVYIY